MSFRSGPRRVPITQAQKRKLFAVSAARAEEILRGQLVLSDISSKRATIHGLRVSIVKAVVAHVGAGRRIYQDEMDPLLDAIKQATVNDAGETTIPTKEF